MTRRFPLHVYCDHSHTILIQTLTSIEAFCPEAHGAAEEVYDPLVRVSRLNRIFREDLASHALNNQDWMSPKVAEVSQ